ncbi:MAG: hypothetical protein M3264_08550, partial [Thermoproteota archaeon]|nr:hypothetical protein [Thermoproteota archaeon]
NMQEDNTDDDNKRSLRVSQRTYSRLLELATFEDKSHDQLINRLLDEFEVIKKLLLLMQQQQQKQRQKRPSLSLSRGGFSRYVRDLESLSE